MTDDQYNRPGVNLEELERQLRVASRSHRDDAVRRGAAEPMAEQPAAIPDIDALRREFNRSREQDIPAPQPVEALAFQPGPPPAFLRQPYTAGPEATGGSNSFDDRFPFIDRGRKKGPVLFRSLFSGVVAVLMVAVGYILFSGKLPLSGPNAPDQKSVPVIKADPNPVKIVPEVANSDDASQAGSELFGKKGGEVAVPTTIRPSAEAPVDVNAVVKGAGPKTTPLVPGMGDPKLVRTVTVRPDGTLIGDQPQPAPSTASAVPVVATPPAVAMTQEAQPTPVVQPSPVVVAAPVKVATAPAQAPVETLPPLTAATTELPTIGGFPVPLPFPRPADIGAASDVDPIEALVAATTNAAPETTAEATQTQSDAAPTGDYAVQFGASPSEAEANAMASKLKGQLIELLESHPLVVLKGDSNGKTVFRVRATGYSRDEAAATCATAGAAGTKCFIAKN